jgi:VWFA-related protein
MGIRRIAAGVMALSMWFVTPLPAAEPPQAPAPEPPADAQAAFRVRTNVVPVRVVVRDNQGHAVTGLGKDDFELLDNGKRQTISGFSLESAIPDRYVLYIIDDLNIAPGDLARTRAAAAGVLKDTSNTPSRIAVLTTSRTVALDFTPDGAKANETLERITSQERAAVKGRCPQLGYTLANHVALGDATALGIAMAMTRVCGLTMEPDKTAKAAAQQRLNEYTEQTRAALAEIKAAVRRIAILPGARTVVLVSPGFLPNLSPEVNEVIDSAARKGVVIDTLDARGGGVLPGSGGEDRKLAFDPTLNQQMRQFLQEDQRLQTGVLMQLAEGTGGAVSQGNDYEAGFRQLTAAPDVSYILGFTPAKLSDDGSYHKLKVTIRSREGLTVQARNGYFAPKHTPDPAEQAKEEMENAVFSRDEIREIPVTLRAQATGTAGSPDRLAVAAHFGIGGIRFVRKDGHNRSSVTLAVSLFNAGGNHIKGGQNIVNLDYPDDKLAAAMASGVDVKIGFDVAPGGYLVRLVLRDNDGHLAATSRLVEAP